LIYRGLKLLTKTVSSLKVNQVSKNPFLSGEEEEQIKVLLNPTAKWPLSVFYGVTPVCLVMKY
jgi:hypothetical protein